MNNKTELTQFGKGKIIELKKGGNAIIYNRVSSKEQLEGQSLEVQLEQCERWAESNNYIVLAKFGGTYESAKTDLERKEFSKMLKYVKANKNNLNAVIVYNTSRFSRTGSTTIIEDLEKLNIAVFSATSGYDPRNPEGKLAQGMELMFARYDNATKSRMVRENGRKALYNGRWINQAPRGYDMKTTKAKQEITINNDGKLIREAFLLKANLGLSNEEVRQRMKVKGLDLHKQRWTDIFRNPFYCGYFSHPYLQGEVIQGPDGIALISEEVFLKVNGILSRNHSGYEQKMDKEYAPLLGTIKCPVCGGNLTASESTKMRKKYNRHVGYYVCSKKNCKFNSATKDTHAAFENTINQYKLESGEVEILKLQLAKTFRALNEENRQASVVIKSNISKKENEIDQVEFNYALATDTRKQAIMEKALNRLQAEKAKMEAELENVSKEILNLDDFINYSLTLRSNLLKMWDVVELGDKRRLQNLVFPQGLIYNKESKGIEPLGVNRIFVTTSCETDESEKKKADKLTLISICPLPLLNKDLNLGPPD